MKNIPQIINNLKSWEDTLRETKKSILLYGMGDGAEKLLLEFEKRTIKVKGVFASDAFVRGHNFRDMPVMTLKEAQAAFGDFLTVPAFALRGYDCKLFTDFPHELVMPNMPVAGDEVCDKIYIQRHIDDFSYIYENLADEKSRQVMESVLAFNITGDVKKLFLSPDESYSFEPHSLAHVDAGAYDGDTALEFTKTNSTYTKIFAIEPDPKNFAKLRENTAALRDVVCVNKAAWSGNGSASFASSKGRGSTLSQAGEGSAELVTIDSLCSGISVGSIKIDCEGSDGEALCGAVNTICDHRPQIAAAVYHRASDMFAIPRLIRYYYPKYKLFMRKINYIPPWDVFCFANKV